MVARSRVCSIGTNQEIKIDLDLAVSASGGLGIAHNFEPGLILLEIGACEFIIEKDLDVGHGFNLVEENLVELASIDSKNSL